MGTRDRKLKVLVRVVVAFAAGVVGSVLVSKLIPEIDWAVFLPMGLAVGFIIPELVTLWCGNE